MQTAEDRQRLLDRVREGYAELLRVLEANVIGPKLMIAITPVQTTGCVVFSEMEPDPDSVPPVRARYKLKDGESTYQPRDSEQPLSYIMLFAMRQYKNDLNETPIRAALTRLFGLDAHIREGFELLAASCKASDGFSVRGI